MNVENGENCELAKSGLHNLWERAVSNTCAKPQGREQDLRPVGEEEKKEKRKKGWEETLFYVQSDRETAGVLWKPAHSETFDFAQRGIVR